MGDGEVEAVRAVTSALARAENLHGGGAVVGRSATHVRAAAALLDAGAAPSVRRDLEEAVANLCQVVGFAHFDIGDARGAIGHLHPAVRLAERSGSWSLRACALSDLARVIAGTGRHDDALTTIEYALVRSDRLPMPARAMVETLHARHLARLGRIEDARRSIDLADRAFAARDPDDEVPIWLRYYDHAEHEGSVGRTLAMTVGGAAAAPRLRAAVASQDPAFRRSRAFSGIRLATVLADLGEPEEAAHVAGEALDRAAGIDSRRVAAELGSLSRAIERSGAPALGETRDRVARLVGRSRSGER